ncbi:MAG: hypothetical protein WBY12_12560, partial [Hyphomicrobium sp.]
DIVRVRVKDVDIDRKRIALTMKSGVLDAGTTRTVKTATPQAGNSATRSPPQSETESALAAALRRAREK